MSEPKYPNCEITGIDHIMSVKSKQKSKSGNAWFEIVHCVNCGHVYGVFPKVVHNIEQHTPITMPELPS